MEYSHHQKERIANQLLEFYKDGKYAFDEDKKRQSQSHYNKKSEIMKNVDKWCKTHDIAKWIIPMLDYNLETDYEMLEKEWEKNHRLAIKIEDLEIKMRGYEINSEQIAKKRAQEMMDEWVSEKEDVAKLHEEVEELKNRKTEMYRRHMRAMNNATQQEERLRNAVANMEQQLRDKQVDDIEAELAEKEAQPSLRKTNKKLENQNTKLEKDVLKLQKAKMELEVKNMEYKTKTENVIADMKTELEKMKLQVEYYKIKDSVQSSAVSLPASVEEVQVQVQV